MHHTYFYEVFTYFTIKLKGEHMTQPLQEGEYRRDCESPWHDKLRVTKQFVVRDYSTTIEKHCCFTCLVFMSLSGLVGYDHGYIVKDRERLLNWMPELQGEI